MERKENNTKACAYMCVCEELNKIKKQEDGKRRE